MSRAVVTWLGLSSPVTLAKKGVRAADLLGQGVHIRDKLGLAAAQGEGQRDAGVGGGLDHGHGQQILDGPGFPDLHIGDPYAGTGDEVVALEGIGPGGGGGVDAPLLDGFQRQGAHHDAHQGGGGAFLIRVLFIQHHVLLLRGAQSHQNGGGGGQALSLRQLIQRGGGKRGKAGDGQQNQGTGKGQKSRFFHRQSLRFRL